MTKNSILKFSALAIFICLMSIGLIRYLISTSELNILPIILRTQNDIPPKRSPDTFAEDYSNKASKGELIFNDDSTFTFKYTKSPEKEGHAFVGAWFPLENVSIDFSKYDQIVIGIKSQKARRIPINLSVQNNLKTHQYVRSFIEIEKNKDIYTLPLNDFKTPASWYNTNNVAQVEIPKQDFSKIEAMSFESCYLLEKGIADEYTINTLRLKKNLGLIFILIISSTIIILGLIWIWIFKPFGKKKEVVHVPIKEIEYEKKESINAQVITFLANNYTNPNLTLSDLSAEFGKGNADLSKIIKAETKLTFPKYLNFIRIQEAKRILEIGDFETISEVGYIVGFNSPSNFIRVFKGQEGVSPKKYLENLNEN